MKFRPPRGRPIARILWPIKYYIEGEPLVNRKRNEMFEARRKGASHESLDIGDRENRGAKKRKEESSEWIVVSGDGIVQCAHVRSPMWRQLPTPFKTGTHRSSPCVSFGEDTYTLRGNPYIIPTSYAWYTCEWFTESYFERIGSERAQSYKAPTI